jgi:HSP20 family protein
VLVAERPQGRFTRQLQLGENLDTQNVEARYANGVLHLTIPVAEAAQSRRIEVQGAGTPQTIEMSHGQGRAEPGSGDEQ